MLSQGNVWIRKIRILLIRPGPLVSDRQITRIHIFKQMKQKRFLNILLGDIFIENNIVLITKTITNI